MKRKSVHKIRIILEDNDSAIMEESYPLPGDLDHLDEIDEAVEGFKNEALPQIEKKLLAQAQEEKADELKKTIPGP